MKNVGSELLVHAPLQRQAIDEMPTEAATPKSRVQLRRALAARPMSEQLALLSPEADTAGAPVQMVSKDGAPGPSPDRQVFTAEAGGSAKPDGAPGAGGGLDADATRGFKKQGGPAKSGPIVAETG